MSDVGAALIGASGFWGPRIADAAARAGGIRLVTCYARDGERRETFARERGIEAAASFEAAIEHSDVDAVLLVTPNDLHAEQALACAERGRHVFVEKPIADTLEAADRMRAVFTDAGLVLAVGHGMRRLGAARRTKELLEEGALGPVVLAEANWSLASKLTPQAWRWYRARNAGGPLMQLGVHHADTLAYWLGPVARSHGTFGHVVTEAEADDVGVLALEFGSGARGVIAGSYVSPPTYTLRLFGTEAVLEYAIDMSVWPQAERADAATTLVLSRPGGREMLDFPERDPLAEELGEFARAVRGEAKPETGAEEGIAALRVILEAL
ncbi:MAG TPA: Gfo/Idh/MocA family oxidoreductase [Gaiellaceae bacterium]|jgi:predicted dehydrogenase|nr:Gfo/Idh/MocA family oxidoreductase [Gaiellaceae bacterium]